MISETKVFKVLSHFNIYELNRLLKFIQSPYFNSSEKLLTYYTLLIEQLKSTDEELLSKEEVWYLIYSGKRYNDQKFRKLSSDLLKLIESFLSIELFQDNPLHQANYLLEALSNKDIKVLYNSGVTTATRLSQRQLERSSTYYYHQYQKEKSIFNLEPEFEKKRQTKDKVSKVNLGEISDNLDKFFIAEKLKYACTLLTLKNVMWLDEKVLFIDQIIDYIESNDFSDTPPILIYYQIYLSTIDPDNLNHYFTLKELITKYITFFPSQEARSIYDSALNYCIRKTNLGLKEFQSELMDLYIEGIENKTLLIKDELSPTTFRNVCFIALRLGKFEWADQFVKEYANYINPKYKSNVVAFNSARINYYKKNYAKVIEYLREVEFEDLIYNLTSKSILLMTYYETDEYESLDSLFESFRVYINRNKSKIPEKYIRSYSNLIKYTKKLTKTSPRDKERINKLREEINKETVIADKFWLLEKLEMIEN